MYGIEKYHADAKKAGITTQLKADKFDEIRDAARDLFKAKAVLKTLLLTDLNDEVIEQTKQARADVKDYAFILERFIQRAAEGDL